MANNRMLLVHVPTGLAVHLGKRYADGWYTNESSRIGNKLDKLYEVLEHEVLELDPDYKKDITKDDFALLMEVTERAPQALGGWRYGPQREDGLYQIQFPPFNDHPLK